MAAAGTPLPELYAKYKDEISQVTANIQHFLKENPEYSKVITAEYPLDDLLVLKYLLSSPKKIKTKTDTLVSVATAAMIHTIKFRFEKHEVLRAVLKQDAQKVFENNYIGMLRGGFLNGCELCVISTMGATDLREVAKKYETAEDMAISGLLSSELMRIILDTQSKKTQRLAKLMSVTDLQGISVMRISSPKGLGAIGIVSNWNDDHSPQMLSRVVMTNTPSMFSMLMKVARPFLSKSTIDKMAFCKQSKKGQDISACPFIAKFGADAASHIPAHAGGAFVE